jgi:membrane-associated phospholipid phosphatase
LGLGFLYTTKRSDERIAALAFGAAYLIAYTFAASILSYLGASLALPLLDAQFARADAALGLDWLGLLESSNRWPVLGKILRFTYATSLAQVVVVFLLLTMTRQLTRLADFLTLFTATSLVTILAGSLLPAAGACAYLDPPTALRDAIGQDAGMWHVAHFEALRDGTLRAIDPATIQGVVQFPSFHTALAVITAWAVWRTRYVALAALGVSALVIVATVPVGGHYFVDVFAGGAIAVGCIATLSWRQGARSSAGTVAAVIFSRARTALAGGDCRPTPRSCGPTKGVIGVGRAGEGQRMAPT